ncbi:sensor histidine kinase [Brevibacterium pityocampae]|uniref:Oxygen sensor histidine kinase NreB n=1 Tax=Brevibacterium pityocampae TaxID=506594 RepID=A0ABP8J1K0_9MICO
MEPTSTPALLRTLRVALHLSFAALLAIGALRVLLTHRPDRAVVVLVLSLTLVLAGVYLAGTVWERNFAQGRTRRDPGPLAVPWLLLIIALWTVLTLHSADFSWAAFPLFFVVLVVLGRATALVCIAGLTAVVVLAQILHAPPSGFSPAMAIGPVIGAIVAVVIGFAYRALYRDAQRHRRTVRALEAARAELALQERAAGRAGERERLSREIHDTLAQGLSSIVLMSRAAHEALAGEQTDLAAGRLQVIEDTAARNLAEARRFVRDLSAPALDADLPTALQALCAQTAELARAAGRELDCRFRAEGALDGAALPGAHRAVLLRAAQSLLANVTAHAGARTAVVTLAAWDDAVTLDVYDDGAGFRVDAAQAGSAGDAGGEGDPAMAAGDHGYGLVKLRARIAELDGTLVVESAPGEGTAVSVRLPLPGAARSEGPAPGARQTERIQPQDPRTGPPRPDGEAR